MKTTYDESINNEDKNEFKKCKTKNDHEKDRNSNSNVNKLIDK